MRQIIILYSIVFFIYATIYSAEFVETPTFVKSGSMWNIAFTVDKPIDATIDIIAKNGKILRRIGSGLLGSNAPVPFAKNSLSQSIEWDGLSDSGVVVADSVEPVLRIRLGLHTTFDRFVCKQSIPAFQNYSMAGMAVGPDRNLYVVATMGKRPSAHLAVYSPAGSYIKTLVPFPADFDPTRVEDFKILSRENGIINPMLHHRLTHSQTPGFVAMDYMTMDINSSGKIVMVSGSNFKEYHKENEIVMLNCDGTVPRNSICGPSTGLAGYLHLAFQPAGDTFYITGGDQAVYKMSSSLTSGRTLFAGIPLDTGSDISHLNGPRGIATDKNGNVYVCDFRNKRIQVYKQDGSSLATITLPENPVVIKVHPVNGTIFVVTWSDTSFAFALNKLSGLSGTIAARYNIGKWAGSDDVDVNVDQGLSIALDHYGDSSIVYIGAMQVYGKFRVYRMSCLDSVFKVTQLKDMPMNNSFGQLTMFSSDPAADHIYLAEKFATASVQSYEYDASNNSFTPFWPKFNDHKIHKGRDGYFYKPDYKGLKVTRRSITGAIVPFSVTGDSSAVADTSKVYRYGERDNIFVSRTGDIYNIYYHGDTSGDSVKMVVHDKDGTVKKRNVLYKFNGARNVTVDSRGNIYVSDNLKPIGSPLPSYLEQLSFIDDNPLPFTLEGSFRDIMMASYGSVLKFGPEGGRCRQLSAAEQPSVDETEMVSYSSLNGTSRYGVSGLQACFRGISLLPPTKNYRTGIGVCNCFGAFYDLDLYDRLAVPDAVQHKIHILDANMNVLHSFGGYDNFDNQGGILAGNRPSIPLELPMQAVITDKAIYVTNYGSRFLAEYTLAGTRILRAALVYDKEYLSGTVSQSEMAKKSNTPLFKLSGFPNPFNPSISLVVNVSSNCALGHVSLLVYDIKGRLIKTLFTQFVYDNYLCKEVVWDGMNESGVSAATGTYICYLNNSGKSKVTKIVLSR